jgi:hypothetical protein
MARIAIKASVVLTLMLGSVLPSTVRAQENDDIPVQVSPFSARADCIARTESHWNPNAVNPRSGASGLGQFLRSTWMTTPYAARSVFDPWANHAAICWMLSVGRAREFDVVRLGLC